MPENIERALRGDTYDTYYQGSKDFKVFIQVRRYNPHSVILLTNTSNLTNDFISTRAKKFLDLQTVVQYLEKD